MSNWGEQSQAGLWPVPTLLTLSLLLFYWLRGPTNCVCVRVCGKKGGGGFRTMSYLFSTGCFLSAAVIDWKQPRQALHSEHQNTLLSFLSVINMSFTLTEPESTPTAKKPFHSHSILHTCSFINRNAERDKWASAWPEYWRNCVEEDWSAKVTLLRWKWVWK